MRPFSSYTPREWAGSAVAGGATAAACITGSSTARVALVLLAIDGVAAIATSPETRAEYRRQLALRRGEALPPAPAAPLSAPPAIDRDASLFQMVNRLPEPRRAEFLLAYQARAKSRSTALLLSIFLGGLAVDRFYLGQTRLAVAKLLSSALTLGLVGAVWWLVDLFLIMGAADRYNVGVVQRLSTVYPAATPSGAAEAYTGPR